MELFICSCFLSFSFFHQGNCPRVSSINDKHGWRAVSKGLTVIGFSEEEVEVKQRLQQTNYKHTRKHAYAHIHTHLQLPVAFVPFCRSY